VSHIWESYFIEVTGNTVKKTSYPGKYIYRSPRDMIEDYKTFIDELAMLRARLPKK